jgi:hypothetical protein
LTEQGVKKYVPFQRCENAALPEAAFHRKRGPGPWAVRIRPCRFPSRALSISWRSGGKPWMA